MSIEELIKSLKGETPTFSGHKLQDRTTFHGLNISIENKAGSVRKWKNREGQNGETKMVYDYGYIRNTQGNDEEHIDCYIGPNEESEKVYIVHQTRLNSDKHDEDKVMLGFNSLKEAKEAYLKHIPKEQFGSIDEMDIDSFKNKVLGKKVDFIKSMIDDLLNFK